MSGPQPVPVREPPDLRPWVKRALLRWNSHYREYERVVASDTLSPALVRFLRFIVVETLDGRGEQLTESGIAEKVFKQREFAPSEKSVVRVEKRRLREKLKDYYEGPGKDDPLIISLGSSFVPIFSPRENGLPRKPSRVLQLTRRWAIPFVALGLALALLSFLLKKPADQFLL